ncbi:MAG: alkaline phosphatase family protein [Anaerolineae bacterium]|nr:alkaline phosphatase family protein [Anaerolineae bacterium]
MPDLTADFLPALKSHRLTDLDLGGEFIYPNYAGQSILNIPASICRLLGIPDFGAPPVIPEILSPLGEGIRRVVFVLMDALALHRLQRWLADGSLPVWQRLIDQGLLAPLTSITPSTTCAALTSLWTGRAPAEHGIAGYEMWLKEYGIVANMIEHKPFSFHGEGSGLEQAGFDPKTFVPLPKFGSHLLAHGIQPYAFQHYSIAHSGLSQIFFEDVSVHSFNTPSDLWISLAQLLESQPSERLYTWAYWGAVDGLSHFHGPDDRRPAAEFAHFSAAFEENFINQLSAAARKDTLLILAADHGQITTNKDPHYDLNNHPGLTRRLHLNPTGENRLAYLHVRPGQTEAVKEYLQRTWPNQFAVLDSAFALAAGLFGPGQPHPGMVDRLGDLVVISRGAAYLWWGARKNPLIGRHGGLSPEEMLVPFLAARL